MRIDLSRRELLALAALAPALGPARAQADAAFRHGIAMHGAPLLPPDFAHLPYADPHAKRGGRLTFGHYGTFDSLNPFIIRGQAPHYIQGLVVQSLMARSLAEPFTLYGQVADGVAWPDDRSSVTFRVHPQARFADGTAIDAEDILFSWALLRDKGRLQRAPYKLVAKAEALDARTVRFDLAGANNRELPLTLGLMPVLSKKATDPARFDQTSFTPPLGSGPYQVADVTPGASFTLRRNPSYWGADIPASRHLFNVDEIRVDFYRDINNLFEAFKAGLIDVRVETDPAKWTNGYDFPAIRDGRVTRETIPIGIPRSMSGFVMNARQPVFSDVRVREAITLLLDAQWINRNLFFDVYVRTQSYFDGSDLSSHGVAASPREREWLAAFPGAVRPDILDQGWTAPVTDGSGRDRDVARRAMTLLGEAGYRASDDGMRGADGRILSFEILVSNRQHERLSTAYAQMLRRVGIEARVRLTDDIQYWARTANFQFDMTPYTFSAAPLPGAEQYNRWGKAAYATPKSLAYAGVQSDAVDAMIGRMLAAREREEYRDAVRALDRVLLSGFHVVPLFYTKGQWVAQSSRVKRPAKPPLFNVTPETPEMLWREDRP